VPTIFVRLDASLSGGDLQAHLDAQAGGLATIAGTVAGLIEHPPKSLGDLGNALQELPLPDLSVDASFATSLAAVQSALPADLTAVIGPLMQGFRNLNADLEVDVRRILGEVLDALKAVTKLTEIDLTCDEPAAGGTPGASGGASGGAGAPDAGPSAGGGAGSAGAGTGAPNAGSAPPTRRVSAATSEIEAILAILGRAPSPFDVSGLLTLLRQVNPLPILDDWTDPLETLAAWQAMTPDGIRAHMDTSLQELTGFVRDTAVAVMATLATDLTAAAGHLHGDALARIASELTAALGELRAAVNAGDLSGTGAAVAKVNGGLDELQTLRLGLQTELGGLPALVRRLKDLPGDLSERMESVLAVAMPSDSLRFLAQIEPPASADAAALAQIQEALRPLLDWLRQLAGKLDLSAVQQPLHAAADAARVAVDGLEQGLAGITGSARALFAQLESALAAVDMKALADGVLAAIAAFAAQLRQKVSALFQPVRAAVDGVVQQISSAVGGFDPQQVVSALRQAIDVLTGVLQDPEVTAALAEIRGALDTAAKQVENISFAPLSDQVIAAIQEITTALSLIDTLQLDTALELALQAALDVLPKDLAPVTDPLVVDFGSLVDAGPAPLLEIVRKQPQALLDKVRSFDPAALVGGTIGKPYKDLLASLDAFRPSRLLAPVAAELAKLEARMRQQADPAAPLQLLEPPFQRLLAAFDGLRPEALVKPLQDAKDEAIAKLLSVVPVEDLLAGVDATLKTVEEVITFAARAVELLDKIQGFLNGLAGSRAQAEAWIGPILAKLETMDTAPLQPRFVEVIAALDETREAALAARFQAAAGPLAASLTGLDLAGKLAALSLAHGTFPRTALAGLPASPQKAALGAALARFDPLDPAFNAPYRAVDGLLQGLDQAQSDLAAALSGWDARFHATGGTLASLRLTAATPAELRQGVREALEPQFLRPLELLLSFIETMGGPLGAVVEAFRSAVDDLQRKAAELLLGPGSLHDIRDALQKVIDRLRGFDLGFLTSGLHAAFADVRSKLAAVDPAQLRQAVETAFGQMLDALSLDQVLPAADAAQLDTAYLQMIAKLRTLDPEQLVVQVVKPEFDTRIVPLLAAFDLTPLLDVLLDRLQALKKELPTELDRVNQAYQAMLAAAPSGGGSVGISS